MGCCGREFSLDTTEDDLESGSSREYVLGVDTNVRTASTNDPRDPQLLVEKADGFPVYVRFSPTGRDDKSPAGRCTLKPVVPQRDGAETVSARGGIWLRVHSGHGHHRQRPGERPPQSLCPSRWTTRPGCPRRGGVTLGRSYPVILDP